MQAAVSLGHYFIAWAKAAFAHGRFGRNEVGQVNHGLIEGHSLEEFSLADRHQDIRMERSSQLVPGLAAGRENIIRPLAAPPKKRSRPPGTHAMP